MTGPEQHADTVREALRRSWADKDVMASFDELVALAERADTLERERDEALRQRNEWAERVGVLRDLRDREGSWGAPYERAVLATDLEQARAEADRLREALREARGHLRPEIGGRFDQRAAVAVIDTALAGPTESAGQASPVPQTKEQTCLDDREET